MTDTADSIGYDASDYEWDNVAEEAPDQLVFDTPGDTYVGEFLGMEEISYTDKNGDEQSFMQLRFRDNSGLKVLNGGYELVEVYKNIPDHTVTRTELKKFVEVGQASKMKSYRVDQAKSKLSRK